MIAPCVQAFAILAHASGTPTLPSLGLGDPTPRTVFDRQEIGAYHWPARRGFGRRPRPPDIVANQRAKHWALTHSAQHSSSTGWFGISMRWGRVDIVISYPRKGDGSAEAASLGQPCANRSWVAPIARQPDEPRTMPGASVLTCAPTRARARGPVNHQNRMLRTRKIGKRGSWRSSSMSSCAAWRAQHRLCQS